MFYIECLHKPFAFILTSVLSFIPNSVTADTLSGTFYDLGHSDTLLVFVDNMYARERISVDTVVLENHHFELQLPHQAAYLRVFPKPHGDSRNLTFPAGKPIYYFPGDSLHLEGKLPNVRVTGSELYDCVERHPLITAYEARIREMNEAFTRTYRAGDKEALAKLKAEIREQYNQLLAEKQRAIQSNPKSKASALWAMELNPEEGLEAIASLADEVKNGPMAPLLRKAEEKYRHRMAQKESAKSVQSGKAAPDFNLKTLSGKKVSLADFKGKYLLLDFWGTWCGWCIKGFPEMKKYYVKYSDKVEFLGICCRDTEERWRKGVASQQLPWVNGFDSESELVVKYAVSGFPTKILIDPQGKIVEVFVGESPALYQKLDSLFKE